MTATQTHIYRELRDEMATVVERYLELADRIALFDPIDAHNLRHMAMLARRIVRCTEHRIHDLERGGEGQV